MSAREPSSAAASARAVQAGFPVRLIALDIDGTIVGEDLVLGPRTMAAVAAARERGVAVSLVTGRMTTSARGFARQLGLTDPIVAYQGALVRTLPPPGEDPRLGRILRHRPLAVEAARDVIAWATGVGLAPHVNHLERFIVQSDDPRAEDYSAFLGLRAGIVDDLRAWIRHPVSKVLAVATDPIPESILDDARRRFAGRAAVTISHPRFLEFLAPGVSKAVGVRHLARRARIPMANVLAIGDQYNDLEMLAAVGHGAAMPGAPAPVRAAARYLAPPLEEEGVAGLIEALVLASPQVAARNAERLGRTHREGLDRGWPGGHAPDGSTDGRTAQDAAANSDRPLISAPGA